MGLYYSIKVSLYLLHCHHHVHFLNLKERKKYIFYHLFGSAREKLTLILRNNLHACLNSATARFVSQLSIISNVHLFRGSGYAARN